MSKLILLRGLPASGKSTKAKELIEAGAVRVNRDLLREMMNFSEFRFESIVVDTEKYIVRQVLDKDKSVVIDDCNLNPANEDMWRSIATEYDVEFEVVEVDTPVAECILRDSLREKQVGADVIVSMALQYGKFTFEDPVVVCDIDGTLADIKHRLHYVNGEKKDWKGFFGAMDKDTVRKDVAGMITVDQNKGAEIVFVSARSEDYRKETKAFLKKAGFEENLLLMRPFNDKRDDTFVKEQIYRKYLERLNIIKVYDDRPKVIRMWRGLGLTVVDVGDGIEF